MSTPCCWGGLHMRDPCPMGTIGTHLSTTEVAVPWETFPWQFFTEHCATARAVHFASQNALKSSAEGNT